MYVCISRRITGSSYATIKTTTKYTKNQLKKFLKFFVHIKFNQLNIVNLIVVC